MNANWFNPKISDHKDAVKEHGEEDAFPGHGKARDNEVAKLRRELKKITEERDFLREGPGTSPGSRSEIRLYPSTSPPALHQDDVPTAAGLSQWLLRLLFSPCELTLMIRQLHLASNGVYGARKIHRELLRQGEGCGGHRAARLMRKDLLKGCAKRRFIRPVNTPEMHPVADNLIKRDFRAYKPNQRWASEITRVWTQQG